MMGLMARPLSRLEAPVARLSTAISSGSRSTLSRAILHLPPSGIEHPAVFRIAYRATELDHRAPITAHPYHRPANPSTPWVKGPLA
eukprot:g38238.t1